MGMILKRCLLVLFTGLLVCIWSISSVAGDESVPAAGGGDGEAPMLQLEETFQGPFPGTIIQRVFDPATGAVCYLYVPERVQRRERDGGIDYGSRSIGTISCIPPPVDW